MIDRRSSTDHPSLAGTDYVLEGASVRDRFLTAFILRHQELVTSAWPYVPLLADNPAPSSMGTLFPDAGEESFSIQVESTCEPLTVRMIDEWFGSDDDGDA